jgi:hypothetical protein
LHPVRADSRYQKKLGVAYAVSRRPEKKKKTSPKARQKKKGTAQPQAGHPIVALVGWSNG